MAVRSTMQMHVPFLVERLIEDLRVWEGRLADMGSDAEITALRDREINDLKSKLRFVATWSHDVDSYQRQYVPEVWGQIEILLDTQGDIINKWIMIYANHTDSPFSPPLSLEELGL